MAVSYSVFFTLYSVSIVVACFLGVLVMIGWKDMSIRSTLRSLQYNAVYIIILAAFPLFVQAQDLIESHIFGTEDISNELVYTNWMFNLAGGAIGVLQDRLDYAIVADFFIIVYAWLFSFLTYFAPVLLLAKGDSSTLRTYAIAMMFNYLILTPFYLMFPVTVTGSYVPAGATPILYVDAHWGKMVTSVDPLNNDFPSGHVSLMTTTLLVFAMAGAQYRRFSYFLLASTILVIFSVLYLGVHWPADVFAGFVLAVAATVLARTDRIQMTIDRYVRILNEKLFGPRPKATVDNRPVALEQG